jgi:excisionase family DNA binding protein
MLPNATAEPSSDPERRLDPLVVTPREACRLLSLGNTSLYALLARGELDSFRHGRARRITLASIRAYVSRRLPDGAANTKRKRGRPRKISQSGAQTGAAA